MPNERGSPSATRSNSPAEGTARSRLVTINGGSSSLKFAVFGADEPLECLVSGKVERIGLPDATWTVKDASGRREPQRIEVPDHAAAVGRLIEWLEREVGFANVAAIGHRVVHGGPRFVGPERITPDLIEELRRLTPLDPDHLPAEVAMIEAFRRRVPDVPQVACFDTSFHHDLPRVAQIVPIPRKYEALGVRRYGFHGLSYAYLMQELERVAGPTAAQGRVILAHLGAGASLAAVHRGRCVETTMAFTPAAGLVMDRRSGDIDPGLVSFLARAEGMTAERFDRLVNRESGLLGISETSPDLHDLLDRQRADVRAAEAVEVFCYQARKWIGALAAVLGGLDTLVFSGGIGENSPEARARICAGLEFLGVALDPSANEAGAAVLSAPDASATVRTIRTDEERMMAQTLLTALGPSLPPAARSSGEAPVD